MDEIASWRGIPIDQLTRGELVEALTFFANRHREMTTPEMSRRLALGRVEEIKRGH